MTRHAAQLVLLIGALLLAACELAPFGRADLERALFQHGDLPPEWAAGDDFGTMVGDPTIRHFAAHRALRAPGTGGSVSVGLYRSQGDATQALVWLLTTVRSGVAPVLIGDEGFISADSVMFRRGACLAVLEVDGGERAADLLTRYAGRLDARLRAIGC